MTRSELVGLLAERFDQLTLRDAEATVGVILGAIDDALVRGNRVEIRGFGTFAVHWRPARTGRNPRTGEQIEVPALRLPHFKPGKKLREAVAQSKPAAARRSRPSE